MRGPDRLRHRGRMKLTEKVQQIYAAFGRGDVPTILEHVADDCDWEHAITTDEIPWLVHGRGRAGATAFFQAVGAELDITQFAVKEVLEGPGVVVATVDIAFTVKRTGKQVREVDEVHVWRFDAAGRVARFKHAADTLQHQRALT
jgi:ketosteroid isomerase-like protein